MPTTYSTRIEVITTDGPKITQLLQNAPANGRKYHDDIHSHNEEVDLGAVFATIAMPIWVLVKCYGTGFQFNIEGLGYSTKVVRHMCFEYTPTPSGPLDLMIRSVGPDQRIEAILVGEP